MRTARDEFLSPQEAGDQLGVSVYTVRRWIQEGRLPAYKPGKEYRIRESDLEEFLRAREVRPKAPRRSPYEPSLLNGFEEERHLSILVDAITEAADTWIAAVADPNINIHKRFGIRDAATELFDRINARAFEEWEALSPESRRDIGQAMGKLNEVPEEAYRAMPDETLKESIELRREKIREWTRRISA